jgi:hypothetical protein
MIKVWFLLILISVPNAPSIKYNGFIYPSEEKCLIEQTKLIKAYNNKSSEYKMQTAIDSHCIEFESFRIKGLFPHEA